MNRIATAAAIMAVGVVAAARLAGAVPAARAAPAPAASAPAAPVPPAQIDVVVRTSLITSPEHLEAYKADMLKRAAKCFGGLVAAAAADAGTPAPGKPAAEKRAPDGAAPYRLFIDHKGSVEVAPAPAAAKGRDDQYAGIDKLEARQKGEFAFRLARWSGSAYPSVDAWSSRFSTANVLMVPHDLPPEHVAEVRGDALMLAMPEAVTRGILDHVLPIRLAETGGGAGQTQTLKVEVENRSLWPLRRLGLKVAWSDAAQPRKFRYEAALVYEGRLMPGQRTVVSGAGALVPAEFQWEYDMPVSIEAEPTFEPSVRPAAAGK